MQITGTKTIYEDVSITVDPNKILHALKMDLFRMYNIPSDGYLNDKDQIVCDERNWRHGSVGTDMLDSKPTHEVIEVMKAWDSFSRLYNTARHKELSAK